MLYPAELRGREVAHILYHKNYLEGTRELSHLRRAQVVQTWLNRESHDLNLARTAYRVYRDLALRGVPRDLFLPRSSGKRPWKCFQGPSLLHVDLDGCADDEHEDDGAQDQQRVQEETHHCFSPSGKHGITACSRIARART